MSKINTQSVLNRLPSHPQAEANARTNAFCTFIILLLCLGTGSKDTLRILYTDKAVLHWSLRMSVNPSLISIKLWPSNPLEMFHILHSVANFDTCSNETWIGTRIVSSFNTLLICVSNEKVQNCFYFIPVPDIEANTSTLTSLHEACHKHQTNNGTVTTLKSFTSPFDRGWFRSGKHIWMLKLGSNMRYQKTS